MRNRTLIWTMVVLVVTYAVLPVPSLAYRPLDPKAPRNKMLRKRAAAQKAGFAYLASAQTRDGSWDIPDAAGVREPSDKLVRTSLAALAFLLAGHTSDLGEHRHSVRNAINWLVRNQDKTGRFSSNSLAHAMATLAVEESWGMSRTPPELKQAAQKAINATFAEQNPDGGWPSKFFDGEGATRERSDLLSTALQLLVIRACQTARLQLNAEATQKGLQRLEAWTDPKTQLPNDSATEKKYGKPLLVAASMLMKYFFREPGAPRPKPDESVKYLLGNLPSAGKIGSKEAERERSECYTNGASYVYFGTLAMFHVYQSWKPWSNARFDFVLATQERDGSWAPRPASGAKGLWQNDRISVTALHVMTNEIYYRYASVEGLAEPSAPADADKRRR